MKLKDNIIRTYESPRPALECLSAIVLGPVLVMLIILVLCFASQIDLIMP